MNRRSFLRLAGGAAAVAIAAPALQQVAPFIRAERLDMGVPSARLATPTIWQSQTVGMHTAVRTWQDAVTEAVLVGGELRVAGQIYGYPVLESGLMSPDRHLYIEGPGGMRHVGKVTEIGPGWANFEPENGRIVTLVNDGDKPISIEAGPSFARSDTIEPHSAEQFAYFNDRWHGLERDPDFIPLERLPIRWDEGMPIQHESTGRRFLMSAVSKRPTVEEALNIARLTARP